LGHIGNFAYWANTEPGLRDGRKLHVSETRRAVEQDSRLAFGYLFYRISEVDGVTAKSTVRAKAFSPRRTANPNPVPASESCVQACCCCPAT
jgi:hypothetical protein